MKPSHYIMDNYGNGTAPSEKLVAIPSQNGHYFTAGKEYPVLTHRAWVYEVRCDRGHLRVISMESGARSAHLVPMGDYRYGFSDDLLGTFEIRKVG